jgi:hypothetical protein
LLKQGIEVNGDQDTGSEAGDCRLSLQAAAKGRLQPFNV